MSASMNENLVRDIVREVLGRLGGASLAAVTAARAAPPAQRAVPRRFGVFQDVDQACLAAQDAFEQLSEQGVAARRRIVEIVKAMARENAREWGKIELDETHIGRL